MLEKFEDLYVDPTPGLALVAGSRVYNDKLDRRQLYDESIGADLIAGDGVDVVCDLEHINIDMLGGRDVCHIDCCSVLEHSKRPWKVAEALEKILKPGGSILISVPVVWRYHGYPDDYYRYLPGSMDHLFPDIDWLYKKVGVNGKLLENLKIPTFKQDSTLFFAKSELYCFGVKK